MYGVGTRGGIHICETSMAHFGGAQHILYKYACIRRDINNCSDSLSFKIYRKENAKKKVFVTSSEIEDHFVLVDYFIFLFILPFHLFLIQKK